MGVRKHLLTVRAVRDGKRFPNDALSLLVFKRHLDNALIICFYFRLALKWSGHCIP